MNNTKGSRPSSFEVFGRWKILFGELKALKFSVFGQFIRQRVYFWAAFVQEAWKRWIFCINRWSLLKLSGSLCYFGAKLLNGLFLPKKVLSFSNFLDRFDNPHCPLSFLIWTLNFWKRIWRIRLFIAQLHCWCIWPGPKFSKDGTFPTAWFWKKIFEKPDFFQSACLILSHFYGLISHERIAKLVRRLNKKR